MQANTKLSDTKIGQLKKVVKKSGGTTRTEVGKSGKYKGVKHTHVEGYGKKTAGKHIVHKDQPPPLPNQD